MLICCKTQKEARFGPLFVLFFILWHPQRVAWGVKEHGEMWESETLTADQDCKRLVGPMRDDTETSSYKPEHTKRCP